MKNFFLAFSTALSFTACENETSFEAGDLEGNPQLQEEVYSVIINDDEMMADFMRQAMQNSENMHQLMMQEGWMEEMFDQESMQYMMQHNEDRMLMMMNNMMQYAGQDSVFRNRMMSNEHWQLMMQQHSDHMMGDHDSMVH